MPMTPAVFHEIVTCNDSGECYGQLSDDKICTEVLSEMAGDREDCSSESDVEEVENEALTSTSKHTTTAKF